MYTHNKQKLGFLSVIEQHKYYAKYSFVPLIISGKFLSTPFLHSNLICHLVFAERIFSLMCIDKMPM